MKLNTFGRVCLILYSVVIFMAITTSVLRVYVRSKILKQYGTAEDWVVAIAGIFTVAYMGVAIAGVVHGLGEHIYVLAPQELTIVLEVCIPPSAMLTYTYLL